MFFHRKNLSFAYFSDLLMAYLFFLHIALLNFKLSARVFSIH
jgi:hypothetical protein